MKQEYAHYLDMKLPRREAIFLLAIIAGRIVYSLGRKVFEPLQGQYQAKKEAYIEAVRFLENNRESLSKLEIGCTLSPEHLEWAVPGTTIEQTISILKELGITQVRFAMRWNQCVTEQNELDLSYYLPWLKALAAANIKITLSLGPIKSPRYPEAHTPQKVLHFLEYVSNESAQKNGVTFDELSLVFGEEFIHNLPLQISQQLRDHGHLPPLSPHITVDSPLALFALDYLDKLLLGLKKGLQVDIHKIVMVNPENEFRNPFGAGKLVMGQSYIVEVCKRIQHELPWVAFLFNNAGVSETDISSLEQTVNAVENLRELFPEIKTTVGIDLYEEQQFFRMLPFLKLHPDTITGLSILYQDNLVRNTLKKLEEQDIPFEATELQFERWGGSNERIGPPGSLHHLQYMVLRYIRTFLVDKPHLIRLWGIEEYIGRYLKNPEDPEVAALKLLISSINELHNTAKKSQLVPSRPAKKSKQ